MHSLATVATPSHRLAGWMEFKAYGRLTGAWRGNFKGWGRRGKLLQSSATFFFLSTPPPPPIAFEIPRCQVLSLACAQQLQMYHILPILATWTRKSQNWAVQCIFESSVFLMHQYLSLICSGKCVVAVFMFFNGGPWNWKVWQQCPGIQSQSAALQCCQSVSIQSTLFPLPLSLAVLSW